MESRLRRPARRIAGLLCIVLAFGTLPARGYAQEDPFAAPPAPKARKSPTEGLIDFKVAVKPVEGRRGETVRVTISGTLKPGYHTYPVTQRAPEPHQDDGQLTKIKYAATPGFKPLYPVTESPPVFHLRPGFPPQLVHERPFEWSQDVLILPDAPVGKQKLKLRIHVQVCDEDKCRFGDHDLDAEVRVSPAAPVPLTQALSARMNEGPPPIKVVPVPGPKEPDAAQPLAAPPAGDAGTTAPPTEAPAARTGSDRGLVGLLLASMGAAVAMLLTPCVFPMIPITVSFFLKQSEKEHHNALLTAAVYSVTIVIVLALAVLVLGQVIVQLANDAWLNLGLGALLVFFALSLFGMYEIELPAGLARFTAAREGRGGYAGAMFMALTFTITSFTCTGPFLGPLLVAVKEYRLAFGERLLAALCYSGTFAAPFFVMALFPSLLKRLPKSGGWLNGVKVVMGFLELAAALKFLANTDLALHPGAPVLFNYDTVLCAWIALALACGLYLLGIFRLPHDSPVDYVGVARMILASIFIGLAIYMTPALWRVTPQGIIGQGLVAFLPLDTRPATAGPTGGGGAAHAELAWHRNYEEAWRQAVRENKLLFIDFTGVNCTNCRYNEINIFPLPGVHDHLARYVRVQLYTDYVPDPSLSSGESQRQAARNSDWQYATFKDVATPLYAVIRPDKDRPLRDAGDGRQRLNGEILGVDSGMISAGKLSAFERFLAQPLATQTARAAADSVRRVARGD